MKKKFKYQAGGAPQAFTVKLPSGQMQPFTPLIQVASQPIDSGFDAYRQMEAMKMQKLQEQRMAQQMEMEQKRMAFEELRYASELEQQKILNEERRMTGLEKMNDPIFNTEFLAADMPLIQELQQKHGLSKVFDKEPTEQNIKEYREKAAKYLQDPIYRQAMRRKLNVDTWLKQAKELNPDAYKEGGIDMSVLDPYYKDFNQTGPLGTPTVKKEYLDKKALALEKDKLDMESTRSTIEKQKILSETEAAELKSTKDFYGRYVPVRDQWMKETDPAKKKALETQMNTLISEHDKEVRAIKGTLQDPTAKSALSYNDLISAGKSQRLQELMATGKYTIGQASVIVDKEFKERTIEDAFEEGNWNEFFSKYNGASLSDKVHKGLTKSLNTMTYKTSDGRTSNITVHHDYTGENDAQGKVRSEEVSGTTIFVPSTTGSMTINGTNGEIHGTIYKVPGLRKNPDGTTTKESESDLLKSGWTLVSESEYQNANSSIINLKGKGLSGPLYQKNGSAIVNIPGSSTPTANDSGKGGVPLTPQSFPKGDYDANKKALSASGVSFSEPHIERTFIERAPEETKTAVSTLSNLVKAAGKQFVMTGHDEFKDGRKHHGGDPRIFDLRSKDGSLSAYLHEVKGELVPTEPLKKWLEENGYAIVYENDSSTLSHNFDSLKAGQVVRNKPTANYDGPHYHFHYVGKSNKPKFNM